MVPVRAGRPGEKDERDARDEEAQLDGVGHGSVLAGRYRLEERVRTRTDGSTWRAVDETLERPVLVRAFATTHRYGAEIVDAARRAALVEDARLQRVLAAGEERGTAYVVLERVPGRSLGELLRAGPLPAESARRIIGEAAEALDRASTRGLHHLRLRPTSLIVGQHGGVIVSGTAIDAAAEGGEPPSSSVARRADAVGLVTLLYTALTGRWPDRQDAGLPRAPRVAGRPVAPGDLVAGVPNDLDTLCAVTLGPHDDGPRSPGDLAADLAPWADAGPLSDPRGLQLGASRPQPRAQRFEVPAGSAESPPTPVATPPAPVATPTMEPAQGPVRREPARGLRARTRSQVQAAAVTTDDEAASASDPWSSQAARSPLAAPTPAAGAPLADTPLPAGAPLAWSQQPRSSAAPVVAPLPPSTPATPATDPPSADRDAGAAARVDRLDEPRAEPRREPPAEAHAEPRPEPWPEPEPESEPEPRAEPAAVSPAEPRVQPAPAPAAAAAAAGRSEAAAPRPPATGRGGAHVAEPATEPVLEPVQEPLAQPVQEEAVAEPPVEHRRREALSRLVRDRGSRERQSERQSERGSGRGSGRHAPTAAYAPVPSGVQAWPPGDPVPAAHGDHGSYGEYGQEPVTGVQALDILGAAAAPVEPVGPFGPAAPLTRPPREQSRLVVIVLAVLVIVLGLFAVSRFFSFDPAPLMNGTSAGVSSTPGAGPSTSSGSAAPSSSSTSAASPVRIVDATAIDPQGDQTENNDLAKAAIDGDPTTSWHSERYDTPTFGGIKKGVGLVLDLGSATTVTTVTVQAPGSDGALQLRSSDSGSFEGSALLSSGRISGSGRVVLHPAHPTSTRYLVLWFTRVPQSSDGRRIVVDEVDVR